MTPAIGVASYRLRPERGVAQTPLSEITFPLGLPSSLEGGVLGDLGRDDHIIFFPKSTFYRRLKIGISANKSLLIAEPRAVHGQHMRWLRVFYRRFYRVLSRDRRFLETIPNGVFHNHAFAFVDPNQPDTPEKTQLVSLIASEKRDQPGHRLRHQIVERMKGAGTDVHALGRAYAPLTDKADGLLPYRYSVVIENSREPAYFSEKLIDAFLCGTIPIYWGAPDISDWFEVDGMIICETEQEIVDVLHSLPDRDPALFSEALARNRDKALKLADGKKLAAERLLREIRA